MSSDANLNDRAMRKNDFAAIFILFSGLLLMMRGHLLEMTKETGPAMVAVSVLGFVLVVAIPLVFRGGLRKVPPGEDEYLRKLLALSAAGGFYFAFAVFVVWVPLTGSMLPAMSAPQLLGVMLTGASIAWGAMRWRDGR